jgi:hypothetical protein
MGRHQDAVAAERGFWGTYAHPRIIFGLSGKCVPHSLLEDKCYEKSRSSGDSRRYTWSR